MPTLPLLLDIKPTQDRLGPVVFLSRGVWEITSKGLKDTLLDVISQDNYSRKRDEQDFNRIPGEALPFKDKLVVRGGLVQVFIKQKGSEERISVYATQVEPS